MAGSEDNRPLPPSLPPATLLWSDEFEGDRLDGSKWEVQLGDGSEYGTPCGWGNNERQWYTDRPQNLRVEGGCLVIQAQHDDSPVQPGRHYTSARIRTRGRYSIAPSPQHPTVRVEACISVPEGLGLWPAFWMLPEGGASERQSGSGMYGGWAASGEIDVMELRNHMQEVIGSCHYGGPWPHNAHCSGSTPMPGGQPGEFHEYAVEWERQQMRWYVDGQLYFTAHSRSAGGAAADGWFSTAEVASPDAPFDQPFHLLLNLALGSEATPFTQIEGGVGISEQQLRETLAQPQQMRVRHVRVYGLREQHS